ncbi:hypothetical protein B566_EDAN000832 [Ephemera danica]|nr:hypothetical protein B566_EDAN000832 [Ephemera danica]
MAGNNSTENLVSSASSVSNSATSLYPQGSDRRCSLAPLPEQPLTVLEKRFLLFVERGDCASVRSFFFDDRHIEAHSDNTTDFNINCVDPLNRSALIAAIENENIELIHILLEHGIQVKDALLHAIKEEYVEAVEILLQYEEKHHVPGEPYSWEAVDRAQSTFTPDITPLVLAAHMNNYEIIKILLDRGATLPTPHDVRCGCDDCVASKLDTILNHDPTGESWERGGSLERLKLAIKYKQKNFVAHPNVQQLLGSIWYEGLPGFRRKGILAQVMEVAKLGMMFPVYSMIFMMAPNSKTSKFMSKPFVKFICYSASYAFFLLLLGAASQRVEFLILEWFGNDWMQEILADWKRRERGSLPGIIECGVIIYVISLITWEMRSLWKDGLLEYISDLWNIVDYCCNMCYATWLALRATSIFITWREYWNGWDPYYPREQWDPFDPMLLSEGMFAAGMILSFLKLVHIFSVNRHMGPLQISLGRMMIDILKFFFIYMLVLFAFGCGTNQLLWYYADLEKQKCYHLPDGSADFDNEEMACTIWRRFSNMFETSQSLFWASFGLVDLMAFELTGIKSFTRFWALLMFGSYSVINVIVLLNMLIAMMSNSYQIISERSDVEWKFARSKLWISYFEEGDVVPPPFNLVPGVKLLLDLLGKNKPRSGSVKVRSYERAMERHETVSRLIVRRFVTAEQRKRDEFVHGKKGKILERRLMKDFQIGFIEGIVNEAITSREPKDVFAKIARAIGKRKGSQNQKSTKKDWNAQAQRKASRRDPIGSSTENEKRRMSRQSLRRYIIEHENSDMANVDSNRLVEYNPKLADMAPAARVAYVKFKTRKIKKEYKYHEQLEQEAGGEVEEDAFEGEATPSKSNIIPVTPRLASVLKKSLSSVSSENDVKIQVEPDAKPITKKEAPPPPTPTEKQNGRDVEVRSVTPNVPAPNPPPADLNPRSATRSPSPGLKTLSSDYQDSLAPQVPARRPSRSPSPKQASSPSPQPAPLSTQNEPGKGKSKLSGQVVQGWI